MAFYWHLSKEGHWDLFLYFPGIYGGVIDVYQLLAFGVKQGASDWHLSAGEPPLFRIHGDLKRLDHPVINREQVHLMLYDIMNDAQRRGFEETLEVDFSFEMGDIPRFRVNVFMQRNGEAAVFRTIPASVFTMDELAIPKIAKDLCQK